jgi:eukaryotic-like serine/threonine-protein kinase
MQNQDTISWINLSFPDLTNVQPLGQGGQKLVFSARHPADREIVLKLIHPSEDPEAVRREILAVQQIVTVRVPRILEVGRIDTPMGSSIWLREQRIMGITLRERLRSGPLSLVELFRFGTHVLEALADAETAHIVHRDVKPDNVMVDINSDYWLLDFGIARHLTMSPITPAANVFGKFTPGYAPPEQFRNIQSEIDARADLFAFGVTFYECATGLQPFQVGAANPLDVLRRVENDPVPRLNLACNESDSLADLISALTQRRRDHRPATVRQSRLWFDDIVAAN